MKFLTCFMITILVLILGYQSDAVSQEKKRPRKKQKRVIGKIPILKSDHIRYIDAHMHLKAAKTGNKDKINSAIVNTLETMDKLGIQKCLLMPPPYTSAMLKTFDYKVLARISKMHPKRFGFIGGGGSLNIMIHQSVVNKQVSSELRKRFLAKAHEIAEAGAAGYGELTGTHFSFGPRHPFINVPADHPLFLALADIAAVNGLPIDIHMEAVPKNMPRPKGVGKPLVSPNPKELTENIKGLENLLAHNRKAKIVWAHVGWGHTGERSAALTRTLLKKHLNLYLGLKFHNHSRRETQLLLPNGKIRTDWLTLIGDYPDRFVLGSDQIFYDLNKMLSEKGAPWGAHHSRTIIDQLPQKLAQKIGVTNPEKVYKLK